ncbi:hypothetical protein [Clostridium tertium]|uniref:hypothetical protein n=1 Tax=Clostridium tertium TaxID=1559 RepID=UPI001AE55A97|nr:hypothetical protein [Clostridium tertium]MBP1868977.1 hypothetical protein [Clostridium tertium]
MKEDKYCIVCGSPFAEEHHIVFRKQQPAMINCPHNKLNLCYDHHLGKESPHMDRRIDIKYKKELQDRLNGMFSSKEIFTEEEIGKILLVPKKDSYRLIKPSRISVKDNIVGYNKKDVIRAAMGGKLYG